MTTRYVVSLIVVIVCVMGARLLFGQHVLARWARPISLIDAATLGLGVLGLVCHCAAMFFRDWVDWLPGTEGVINQVRGLGTASIIWYVVPSVLVIAGLRRINRIALIAVGLLLAAVGVTMYNGSSLAVHLTWIFVLSVGLAGLAATSVLPPWQQASSRQS